jgi:Amt family ammonium transporter
MADSSITPVTEWPDYGVDPTGGDPITHDLNAPYDKVPTVNQPAVLCLTIE